MKCGRVVPRLPLRSDDEFVVKVAWEGPEEAESTFVFDGATAVLRNELKALRLKIRSGDSYNGIVSVLIILWFGGDPEF